jgi:hypothetical protein
VVNYINPQVNNNLSCKNCQAVTTNDGRTVWVCEQCGTENPAQPVTPDALDAQSAISDAAAAAGAPMPDLSQPAIVPDMVQPDAAGQPADAPVDSEGPVVPESLVTAPPVPETPVTPPSIDSVVQQIPIVQDTV